MPYGRITWNLSHTIANYRSIRMLSQMRQYEFSIEVCSKHVVSTTHEMLTEITIHYTYCVISQLNSCALRATFCQHTVIHIFVFHKVTFDHHPMTGIFELFDFILI